MKYVTMVADDGRKVVMTAAQADSVKVLAKTRKGGCASVIGYRPSSNWDVVPTHDIQMITRFSYKNMMERKLAALQEINYKDVAEKVATDPVLSQLSAAECLKHFNDRKAKLVASLSKGDDEPKNAHQLAHERVYAMFDGIKVHLKTEKVDGIKEPVIENGKCVCETIMVPYLELNVKETSPGVRKVVDSGAPVRMGNHIEGCLNKRSVIYKTLSLKADNFEAFRIDRQEFLPEDVAEFGDILAD